MASGDVWPYGPVYIPVTTAVYPWPTQPPPPMNLTVDVTFSLIPPRCGQCTEQATCAYSYGAESHYACASHDPTRQPFWLTAAAPMSFTYRTLASPLAVQHTTGHLGIAAPGT